MNWLIGALKKPVRASSAKYEADLGKLQGLDVIAQGVPYDQTWGS